MAKDKFPLRAKALVDNIISRGVSVAKVLRGPNGEELPNSEGSADFRYAGTDGEGDYVGKMYYSDRYFDRPSTEYNNSLATASLALAMSCGNSSAGYEEGFCNAEDLLASLGFRDIEHNRSFESLSSLDTIGVVIGSRDLGDGTLLCVGIRGIGYGSEWGANLILGTGIYHQGFDEASDRVLEFMREYLGRHEVSGKIKIWITGYSRSASTANLAAGKLDTAYMEGRIAEFFGDGAEFSPEGLYAYCFEPAETVESDAFDIHGPDYRNIWNHINPNDPIPILVTSCFGMERFGTDVMFPCSSEPNYRGRRDRMLEFYRLLPNREQIGMCRADLFKTISVHSFKKDGVERKWRTQVEFLSEINRKFSGYIGSREYYVENIQAGLSEYVARRNAYGGSEKFKASFRQALADNKLSLVAAILYLEIDDSDGVKDAMMKPVSEAAVSAGLDPAMVDGLCNTVSEILMIFRGFIRENKLMTLNFLLNARTIFFAHYPEFIFAWMMSRDLNYRI